MLPSAIGMAATFDPQIVSEMGRVIAEESVETGVRQVLSPTVDVVRDARWGLVGETYGEDPRLTPRMALAFCKPL